MNAIIIQTICYGAVMFFVIFAVAMILKGFFLNYCRVRMSFGRLILIKIKSIHRDYFAVGKIVGGFLVYKCPVDKQEKRIAIEDNTCLYRSLAVSWIDINEQKNSIIKQITNKEVTGFDSVKYNDLYLRALSKPSANMIDSNKIMLVIIILMGIMLIVNLYLSYKNYSSISTVGTICSNIKSTVVNATGIVMGI